jgi:pimeloyl-ACP methyl ester carboxylesterase
MPKVSVNGAELYYEETGQGPETAVFAHGLLWSTRMYDAQVAALRDRYRCITFDLRGHGQSEAATAGHDMDTQTEDAAALITTLGAAPCHFVGLSMGGFIGIRLAARRPELLRSLALLATSAGKEPFLQKLRYLTLAYCARYFGLERVLGTVMRVMFSKEWLKAHPRESDPKRQELERQLLANDPDAVFRAAMAVLSRSPVLEEARRIAAPTLVLVGKEDRARPVPDAEQLSGLIAGSRLVVVPGAGHTVTVEKPEAVTEALLELWTR